MSTPGPIRLVASTSLTIGALAALAVTILCRAVDHWLLSFFYSYAVHLGAAGFLAALAALLIVPRNLVALAALIGLLDATADAQRVMHHYRPDPMVADASASPGFRLLSFNVLNENRTDAGRLHDRIVETDADVVFLLEALPLRGQLGRLAETYPYRVGCGTLRDSCTSLILSRYPLSDPEVMDLSHVSRSRFVSAEISVAGAPVRLALLHTTKPYYDGLQCDELNDIGHHLRRYRDSNLLAAGDFNSAILAPCLRHFLNLLRLKTAPQEPSTWPVRADALAIPIDHVFARAPLKIVDARRLPHNLGSNHFGIVSDVVLDEPARPELLARQDDS
jgi:endonuclease/exonuclease/phosphatase (EEP) superfamily protein YafD